MIAIAQRVILIPLYQKELGKIKTGLNGVGSIQWGFALMLSLLVMLRYKFTVLSD
ncbi:MAG: hypothetical protein ACI9B7_000787 [Oleispira sp.]